LDWEHPRPSGLKSEAGLSMRQLDDHSILVAKGEGDVLKDTYSVEIPFDRETTLTGIRMEALADDLLENKGPGHTGNFMVRRIRASVLPVPNQAGPSARFVRLEFPGQESVPLSEVQIFSNGENIAPQGEARRGQATRDRELARPGSNASES